MRLGLAPRKPAVAALVLVAHGAAGLAMAAWARPGVPLQPAAAATPLWVSVAPEQRAAPPARLTQLPRAATPAAPAPALAPTPAPAPAQAPAPDLPRDSVPSDAATTPLHTPTPEPAVAPMLGVVTAAAAAAATATETRPHQPPRSLPADHAGCARAAHPALLRERGVEGVVRLRVQVQADGSASEVELQASSGYRLFDEAALAQARQCRFRPALQDGSPVSSWVEYPVRFVLAPG